MTMITNIFEESRNGSYLYSESAITEMRSLISLGLLESPGEETKEWHFKNLQRQGGACII